MLYVHVAEKYRRDIPLDIIDAAADERDPDQRVLNVLSARGSHVAAKSATPRLLEQF